MGSHPTSHAIVVLKSVKNIIKFTNRQWHALHTKITQIYYYVCGTILFNGNIK